MAMIWAMALLVVALLATVICVVWAVMLRASDDPEWKVPAAMGMIGVASAVSQLELDLPLEVSLTFLAIGVGVYLAWSYRREHRHASQDQG